MLHGLPGLAAAHRQYAVVGGWSSQGTTFYELPSLTKVGSTDALGSFSEALLPVPGTCSIWAGSSTCCSGETPAEAVAPGMGFSAACAAGCSVRSATVTLEPFAATATGAAPSLGQGPDALAAHPSGRALVANMGGNPPDETGGMAAFVAHDASGALQPSPPLATPLFETTSHIHMITTDPSCGTDAKVLLTDAAGFALGPFRAVGETRVMVANPRTAAVEDVVAMPSRLRQLALHPTLPVAYALYEFDGTVGISAGASAIRAGLGGRPSCPA